MITTTKTLMLFLLATLAQAAQLNPHVGANGSLRTVVLIGATGAGKSLLGNLLSDSVSKEIEVFATGGGLDPTTWESTEHRIQLLQLPRELRARGHGTMFDHVGSFGLDQIQDFLPAEPTEVLVVDTPGLGDGKDNIRMIADKIKDLDTRYQGVDRFVIVINGEEPRFTQALAETLQEFELAFTGDDHTTEEWLQHVTFVFTRWGYSPEAVRKRKRQQRPTEDALKSQFNNHVADTLKLSRDYLQENPVPCVFIDTFSAAECDFCPNSRRAMIQAGEIEELMVNRQGRSSEEYLKYVEQLANLRDQISTVERFPCSHISAAEVVRKRLDAGRFDGVSEVCCTCSEFTGINMRDFNDDPLGDIRGPGYRCRYCSTYGRRYSTDLAISTREGIRYGVGIGYGGGAIAGVGLTVWGVYSLGVGTSILMCLMGGVWLPVVIVGFTAAGGGLAGGAIGAAVGGAGAIPIGAIHAAAYDRRALTDASERVTFTDGSVIEIRGRNRSVLRAIHNGDIEMANLS